MWKMTKKLKIIIVIIFISYHCTLVMGRKKHKAEKHHHHRSDNEYKISPESKPRKVFGLRKEYRTENNSIYSMNSMPKKMYWSIREFGAGKDSKPATSMKQLGARKDTNLNKNLKNIIRSGSEIEPQKEISAQKQSRFHKTSRVEHHKSSKNDYSYENHKSGKNKHSGKTYENTQMMQSVRLTDNGIKPTNDIRTEKLLGPRIFSAKDFGLEREFKAPLVTTEKIEVVPNNVSENTFHSMKQVGAEDMSPETKYELQNENENKQNIVNKKLWNPKDFGLEKEFRSSQEIKAEQEKKTNIGQDKRPGTDKITQPGYEKDKKPPPKDFLVPSNNPKTGKGKENTNVIKSKPIAAQSPDKKKSIQDHGIVRFSPGEVKNEKEIVKSKPALASSLKHLFTEKIHFENSTISPSHIITSTTSEFVRYRSHHKQRFLVLNGNKEHTCIEKCDFPKCEVECKGRRGSAACTANSCRSTTKGQDSASLCTGELCHAMCFKEHCTSACEGDICFAKCHGKSCQAVSHGIRSQTVCQQDDCMAWAHGEDVDSKCEGHACQAHCVGDHCESRCKGTKCVAGCQGANCKSECTGDKCKQMVNQENVHPNMQYKLPIEYIKDYKETVKIPENNKHNHHKHNKHKNGNGKHENGKHGNGKHGNGKHGNGKHENGKHGNGKENNKNYGSVKSNEDYENSAEYSKSHPEQPTRHDPSERIVLGYTMTFNFSDDLIQYVEKKLKELAAKSVRSIPNYLKFRSVDQKPVE